MKKFFKKSIAMLLTALMVVSLAACGGQTKTPGDGTGDPVSTSKTGTSGKKVTLKWAFWGPEPVEVIKKFNDEHPNITLEYEMLSSDQYVNIINTRLMSGEGPDIFSPRFVDNYEKLVSEGRVVELTDKEFMKNYSDEALNQIKASDGKIYAFTESALFLFCYYNKDIFKANNIAIPTNWEEYLEACGKLKSAGIVPQVQGMKDLWNCKYVGPDPVLTMTMRDNMWPEKLSKGEVKFTDANAVASYKRVEDLIKKGYIMDGSLGLTFIQAWQLFCEGKAAMMAGGTWYSAQAFPSAKPSFDLGVMPIPFNDKGEEQVVPYGAISGMQVVNKESKNIDEAMLFAEWFSQTENLQLYANTTKNMSPGRDVVNNFSPEIALYDELLKNYKTIPFKKEPATITTDYGKVIQNMLLGDMNAESAAAEMQKKVEETLLKK